jgi:hypothetical protein
MCHKTSEQVVVAVNFFSGAKALADFAALSAVRVEVLTYKPCPDAC